MKLLYRFWVEGGTSSHREDLTMSLVQPRRISQALSGVVCLDVFEAHVENHCAKFQLFFRHLWFLFYGFFCKKARFLKNFDLHLHSRLKKAGIEDIFQRLNLYR